MTINRRLAWWATFSAVLFASFGVGRLLYPESSSATSGGIGPAPQLLADFEALSDGVITKEEYRAAFDRNVACREATGARIAGPVFEDRFGRLGVEMVSAGDSSEVARGRLEAAQACRREYFDAIDLAWSQSHGPTESDFVEARILTARCLNANGLAVSSMPGPNEIHELFISPAMKSGEAAPAGVAHCLNETSERLKWPGYWGN